MHYSLIEYKLRKYLYLGNEYSLYIPPSLRSKYLDKKNQDDIVGVRIIGKIVNKNKIEDINSIVSIFLKIKEEDKLYDDRILIFALAVCTRFNLKQCVQMVTDAYKAVSIICTDGLKLLMFVKFCKRANQILIDEGYLPNGPTKFGAGFCRALNNWYLNKDPLLTTELILRHKRYDGWSHRDVMQLIHIHSKDPSRQMFIAHTKYGMNKVEELFGLKLKNVNIDDKNETFENKQLKFIYNFLNQVNNLYKMDETTLKNEIEYKRFGHLFEVIPHHMLNNSNILTALVMHMPLRTLLDNTFFFAKHKLFFNSTPDLGLWGFILRFNNTLELEKSKIHPIESFLEYVRYSRTSSNIIQIENNIFKKQNDLKIDVPNNKLITPIEINSHEWDIQTENVISNSSLGKFSSLSKNCTKSTIQNSSQSQDEKIVNCTTNSTKNEDSNICKSEFTNSKVQTNIKPVETQIQLDAANQKKSNSLFLRPLPKIVDQLLKFLSEDLINKTLNCLKPSGRHIMIAYDNRMYVKKNSCAHARLVSIHEAITIIILSLIYPDKLPKKPTVRGFIVSEKQCSNEVNIDYNQPLTFANLESILFAKPASNSKETDENIISEVYPLSTIKWAKANNEEYDVFVFLGTNKMNFRNIRNVVKEYRAFTKKKLKIIVCCLNGKHYEQRNLSREQMLLITGFDRNVGKIIDSFLNDEF